MVEAVEKSELAVAESKPGYKTSEFWLAAVSSLLVLLNQSGLIGALVPVDTVMSVAGIVATYIAGRTVLKK